MSDYLTERELAKRFKLTMRALQKRRSLGQGPAYFKLGRSIRYRLSDIEEYERGAQVTPEAKGSKD